MAGIQPEEIDYWKGNYGIHLSGYKTMERADKSRDHTPLLRLLDDLAGTAADSGAGAGNTCPSDTVLALARHAARLSQAPRMEPEFPLRVHREKLGQHEQKRALWSDEFNHLPIERFLEEGPSRAVLTGLPGSGKSYSLKRAAARLSENLHKCCLSEPFDEKMVMVPVLADLKLYQGDIFDLINRALPVGLSLEYVLRRFRVKILLDSFNEMPREYWESGSYETDLAAFAEKHRSCTIIIGSRTSDGLAKLGFPSYCIDQIDAQYVGAELQRLNLDISGRFEDELRHLLQQPFYFHMVANGTVSLPGEAHPRDFYKIFFEGLTASFQGRFRIAFNIEHALSLCAYEAINQGDEAQPLSRVLGTLQIALQRAGCEEIKASDVANWLVSRATVIPYRGARVAFFHQSATEYLAALELARRYQEAPDVLKEKLHLMRWDHALFLTLSLLPPAQSMTFFRSVVETDFALALNAVKYVEFGRDDLIARLLVELPRALEESGDLHRDIMRALESGVPVSETHEPQIRALMKRGDMIGAAAVHLLVELKGPAVKGELLQALL